MDRKTGPRPIVVAVVAAFLLVATLIAPVTGATLLLPGTRLDALWRLNENAFSAFSALGRTSGVLLVLLGCATAAAGIGLLRGWKWAWWIAVSIFLLNGLGDLITLFATRDWLRGGSGVLIATAFLVSLLNKKVRVFFAGPEEI